MRYFLLHKPRGCITSTVDDTGRGRPTVYDVAKAAGKTDSSYCSLAHRSVGLLPTSINVRSSNKASSTVDINTVLY